MTQISPKTTTMISQRTVPSAATATQTVDLYITACTAGTVDAAKGRRGVRGPRRA